MQLQWFFGIGMEYTPGVWNCQELDAIIARIISMAWTDLPGIEFSR